MKTSKERLIEFLAYLGVGQNTFEKKVEISNGYISHSKGSIGSEIVSKISEKYPELNTEWLMTGKGEMLKNNQQIGDITHSTVVGANVNGNGINITNNNFSEMIELQKGYQELLKKKDEHISDLILIVNKLTNNGK
jgi:hypothetical protein